MCEPCKNDCHAKDMEAMNRLISEIKGTMDRWLNDKMPTCCNELLSGLIDAVNDIAPTEKCDSCEFPKGHDCLHCNCPKCCEKGRTEKRFCVARVGGIKCDVTPTDGDLCDDHKGLDNT